MPGVPCPAALSPLPTVAREVWPPCAPAVPTGAAHDFHAAGVPGMNGAGECARIRDELGVYVVGAIEPGERARVDRHLACGPWGRGERAGLCGRTDFAGQVAADGSR